MLKYLITCVFLICFLTCSTKSQNYADSGYYYQKIGFKEKAADFFEEYLYSNPDNFQVRLDLAYLYQSMNQPAKSREQFEYVGTHSTDEKQIQMSKDAIAALDKESGQTDKNPQTNIISSKADSGYYYLNQGNKTLAAKYFELHLKDNPRDTKTRLQLGYIYYDQKKLGKSLKHFDYVGKHSTSSLDVEASRSAAFVIREELALNAKRSLDIYFYSFYDTYQENFIANLIGHVNFRIAKNTYTGFYLDVYTDTRSRRDLVYNDRFVELGGFLRYNFLKNLFFEFRIGFAHQLNQDSNSINLKPMLVYFNRLGNAKVYSSGKSSSKTSLYLDMYYAAMYDLKYRNAFLQVSFEQVVRFNTGGYSYIENYLAERGQFDSRRLDYNNFIEVGTGLRFHPNIPYFPIFFVEPTYKIYFFGNTKNSFQLKAGFSFNFRTQL
ncbi:MAG TPA: hypothetical protein VGK25_01980 [Ignavibacteria bacterium]|jgi:tetratricopeptide (TPR) repeat protein